MNEMARKIEVVYKMSLYPSKFFAYHSCRNIHNIEKDIDAIITVYLYHARDIDFDNMVYGIVYLQVLERICLERAINKIRLKKRCNPCKMEIITKKMFECINEI